MEQIQSFLVNSPDRGNWWSRNIKKERPPTVYELVVNEHLRLITLLSEGKELKDNEVELLTSAMCEFDFTDLDERHYLWSCLTFWGCQDGLKPYIGDEDSNSV